MDGMSETIYERGPSMTHLELRATLAMRAEDLRIAAKHRAEAGARPMTPANQHAYLGALRWENTCREREQAARGAVVRVSLGGQS